MKRQIGERIEEITRPQGYQPATASTGFVPYRVTGVVASTPIGFATASASP